MCVTYFSEYNFIIAEEYSPGNSRDDSNEYNEDDSSYNDEVDEENSSSNSNFYDKVRYMLICWLYSTWWLMYTQFFKFSYIMILTETVIIQDYFDCDNRRLFWF